MKHVSADYAAFMNKCLIFSNYFYPKFNLLELKKKLKNNLQFPFLHCFYSSFLICTCGRFFYLIIIIISLMMRKFLCVFGCLLHYRRQDQVDLH